MPQPKKRVVLKVDERLENADWTKQTQDVILGDKPKKVPTPDGKK